MIGTVADEILGQLKELHKLGINDVIITGHSQGGALAHLMRAYLEHLPRRRLPANMQFKTYAFAAPMVGDKAFAVEYERDNCTRLTSFNIIEPEDPVPNMPTAYKDGNAFSLQNIMAMITGGQSIKSSAKNALLNIFSGAWKDHRSCGRIHRKRVEAPLVRWYAGIPPGMELFSHGKRMIELDVFEYPKILVELKPGEDDPSTATTPEYKKEPGFFHHKPYNYYVGVLKRYFPDAYEALEIKVLPENL